MLRCRAKSITQRVLSKSKKSSTANTTATCSRSITSSKHVESVGNAARERVDCVVIGAGVVGLAVARELSLKHRRQVLVIDSAPTFGTVTSSRNSEVIHAGIYYPPQSLKTCDLCYGNMVRLINPKRAAEESDFVGDALFCLRGRELLYTYCKDHGIPHQQIGKLIVASRLSEVPKLNALMNRATENGVDGLRLMEGIEATILEPELQCVKALFSPVSGIVDSHSLMLSLVGEAESQGTMLSYKTSVIGGKREGNRINLHVCESNALENWDGSSPLVPDLILVPRLVVNAAGLGAPELAKRFEGLNIGAIPTSYYARGCYFSLSNTKKPPFQHLIYPIPEDGGLGVHVTLDLNGQVKFGPDVEWIDGVDDISRFLNRFDYSVSADRAKRFYPEIRKYYPNLKDGSLEPSYSGIRPKLSGPNQAPSDFVIQGEETHGVGGLVNLFGIESPGLTSSLAIAEYVAARFITK